MTAPTAPPTGHRRDRTQLPEPAVVIVVDDEAPMRSALKRLFLSSGLLIETYASGGELLDQARLDRPGCLLLDVKMPGMDGLEVQAALQQRSVDLPTIFLTGSADIPVAVAAMRAGAVDFIEKPFDNEHLLARVRQAIDRQQRQRLSSEEGHELARRLATLSPREREVLEQIVAGKTSKEIARILGGSHRTIEIHRTHLMEKMAAQTLADLVRMRLQGGPPQQ